MPNENIDPDTINIAGPYVTDAMLETLKNYYDALKIEKGESARLDISRLEPEDQDRLALDVSFYLQNPTLPLENLCSGLDNYDPGNESQEELLLNAKKLIAFPDYSRPAGLWVYGEPGVGKTHIAVAMAKEFMKRGYQPNFVQFGVNNTYHSPCLEPQQVWIMDDLNSPYGMDRDVFLKSTMNAFNTGGKIFVTSNMDYDKFMTQFSILIGEAETARFIDRIQNTFLILEVTGESYRQNTAWYN